MLSKEGLDGIEFRVHDDTLLIDEPEKPKVKVKEDVIDTETMGVLDKLMDEIHSLKEELKEIKTMKKSRFKKQKGSVRKKKKGRLSLRKRKKAVEIAEGPEVVEEPIVKEKPKKKSRAKTIARGKKKKHKKSKQKRKDKKSKPKSFFDGDLFESTWS